MEGVGSEPCIVADAVLSTFEVLQAHEIGGDEEDCNEDCKV